jgi:purine nucleoside permease
MKFFLAIDGLTAEEDNATLEALLRATLAGLVDFSRIILMRTASDFDREAPGETAYDNLFTNKGGFLPSIVNIYIAGSAIVSGILSGWDTTFDAGIPGMFDMPYLYVIEFASNILKLPITLAMCSVL